jgi:hypothetical protein
MKLYGELLQQMRFARDNAGKPQKSESMQGLSDDMLSRPVPRRVSLLNVLCFFHDLQQRETPESCTTAFAECLHNGIQGWHRTQNVPDFDVAHLMEEEAEAMLDIAEAQFRIERSAPALHRLEQARREHAVKADIQIRAARQTVGGSAA